MSNHQNHHSYHKLSFYTTIHCLMGCGLGEIVGVIIGIALGLSIWPSITIGVILGFVFGFYLGIIPLVKVGKTPFEAFKIIFLAEFISIAVMETGEVLAEVFIPGVMSASLSQPIFWFGMLGALITGFLFAYPVNYIMVKRNIKHCH